MTWFDDMYSLELSTWRWTKVRVSAAAAAPPPAPAAGGSGGVWGSLARNAAARAAAAAPSARAAHACCVVGGADEKSMVLFGGRSANGRLNDLWLLEGGLVPALPTAGGARWSEPSTAGQPPSARSFHAMSAVSGSVALLYGGLDVNSRHLDDLHVLHAAAGHWAWARVRQADAPSPRAAPLLTCAPPYGHGASGGGTRLLCFGGSSADASDADGEPTFLADAHTLDLSPLLNKLAEATAEAEAAASGSAAGTASAAVDTAAPPADASAREIEMAKGTPEGTEHATEDAVEPSSKRARLNEQPTAAEEQQQPDEQVAE
jgi:hypothetical protein